MACARSSTRSSAASIPHESRTRSAGTAAAGALDRLVRHRLRDLDQRLHAAERLGEREDLRSAQAIRVASGAGTRPCRRSRASGRRRRPRRPRSHSLTTRAFSVCAAIRRCSVRSPRCTRKQSSGPGTAPIEFCTKRTPSWRAGVAHDRPRRRPRRSARRGTSSSSARRRRRRAPAAAGRPASRTCCRRPRTRSRLRATIACDVDHLQRRVGRRLDPDQLRVVAAPRAATASRSVWSTIVYSRPQRVSTLSTSR